MVNYVIERKNKIINVLKGFFLVFYEWEKTEILVPSFSLDKIVIIPSDFLLYFLVDIVPVPTLLFRLSRLNCTAID
jgi:hypothetical protein